MSFCEFTSSEVEARADAFPPPVQRPALPADFAVPQPRHFDLPLAALGTGCDPRAGYWLLQPPAPRPIIRCFPGKLVLPDLAQRAWINHQRAIEALTPQAEIRMARAAGVPVKQWRKALIS